jgi:hypothetical protein
MQLDVIQIRQRVSAIDVLCLSSVRSRMGPALVGVAPIPVGMVVYICMTHATG